LHDGGELGEIINHGAVIFQGVCKIPLREIASPNLNRATAKSPTAAVSERRLRNWSGYQSGYWSCFPQATRASRTSHGPNTPCPERTVRKRGQKPVERIGCLPQLIRRRRLRNVIRQMQFAERQQGDVGRRESGNCAIKFRSESSAVENQLWATASSAIFRTACRCRSTGAFVRFS